MFALALITLLGPSLETVIVVVVVTQIPIYARMVRTQTLALRSAEFIMAERVMGAGFVRILAVHILPNVIGPLLIPREHGHPLRDHHRSGPLLPRHGGAAADAELGAPSSTTATLSCTTPPGRRSRADCRSSSPRSASLSLGESLRDVFDPKLRKGRVSRPGAMGTGTRSAVLEVRGLNVEFATARGPLKALRNVDLDIPAGSVVGVVGESGSGKSTLAGAVMRLLAENTRIRSGEIHFEGQDLLEASAAAMRAIRGERISMVFQDPMTSLNPVLSIGTQMVDIQYRRSRSREEKTARAVEMLRRVGIPDAERRMGHYPHQFSGGMRQPDCDRDGARDRARAADRG